MTGAPKPDRSCWLSLDSSGGAGLRTAHSHWCGARPAPAGAQHPPTLLGLSLQTPAHPGLSHLKTEALAAHAPLSRFLPRSRQALACVPVPSLPHCTRRKLPLQASHLPGSLLTLHTPRHCPSPWARLPLLYTFSCLQAPLDIPPDPTLDTACAITPHAGHQGATVLACSPPLPRSLALSSTSFPVPTAPGGPGFLSVGESLQQRFRAPACPSPCSPHLHLLLPFHSVGPRVSGALAGLRWTVRGRAEVEVLAPRRVCLWGFLELDS